MKYQFWTGKKQLVTEISQALHKAIEWCNENDTPNHTELVDAIDQGIIDLDKKDAEIAVLTVRLKSESEQHAGSRIACDMAEKECDELKSRLAAKEAELSGYICKQDAAFNEKTLAMRDEMYKLSKHAQECYELYKQAESSLAECRAKWDRDRAHMNEVVKENAALTKELEAARVMLTGVVEKEAYDAVWRENADLTTLLAKTRTVLEEVKMLIIGPNGPLYGIDSKFIDRVEDALAMTPASVDDANDSFEEAAKCFYRAAGMLMPGKDIGSEANWTDEQEEERRRLFKVWCAAIAYMKGTNKPASVEGEGRV